MMHIDKDTYQISKNNQYKIKTVKTQIVIGLSLRKDHFHIIRLKHKDYGKTKKWNTYTISRDGKVYQHYDNKFHSNFIGVKIGDKQSISIVLENMGCLFETSTGKYINWINEFCDIDNIIEKEWSGYNYWENFPDIQIESMGQLCKKLCEEHNIPKVCIEFNTYHKDISKFKGIVFRSNYIEESSDLNPLIDIKKFNEILY